MGIKNVVTRSVGRTKLTVQKNSPHLMFGTGLVGILTSTVLACRSTLKLEKTLENIQADLDESKAIAHDDSEESGNREIAFAYARGTLDIAKLYGPAVIVGGVSIALLTGSHLQLTRRNTALTVAYTGLQQAYSEYRARVREHVGDETELDLYRGIKREKVEGDDGKKHTVPVMDPNKMSVYAVLFDECSPEWNKDPEINRMFLQCQQNYMNHRLTAVGHVFLNEVYDAIGVPRTKAGAVVGWVISKEGDNFVDFGIFEAANSKFINGLERSIWLDFNVDGIIYDKI